MLKRQKSFAKDYAGGILYLVPTPIGNLEDITMRSLKILSEVDRIASEDTRNTLKLLNHFRIKKQQISLHEYNIKKRIIQLLSMLKAGERIAQVSDAGMPSISDPGFELVYACIQENIPVISLPGATAGITALIASGLLPQPFFFYGFLPRKRKKQLKVLDTLRKRKETQIFYESPFRIKGTLLNILEVYGNRNIVLCRELTKFYEEYLRAPCSEILKELKIKPIKGELCLLVSGYFDKGEDAENWKLFSVEEHVKRFLQENDYDAKTAIKEVAKLRGIRKQEVYAAYYKK
ncbi:MAG: 16S rRNA (cytidine(1402)-2'-O)-methyltransferase [Streptococcaceae bacterium]|nr:16S rRNA (cytidine(1402)-2'-O)-methyltransferase [Streptococcaceae bacterium]